LVERLGITFRLTDDIIPKQRDVLEIPPLDLRLEPAMARRGFLVQDGGYENTTMFSYEDYAKLIDQMAKMKCNYMQFWWFSYEPWLKFGYKGEIAGLGDVSTKESGYLTGAFVHPLDLVNREIQVNRLRALLETYPEAEGYFLNVGEMYPELNNEKHREFFEKMRPEFFELRKARFPWVIDIPQDSDPVVDSNIGYFDLFKFLLNQRDAIAPKAKIGLMGIGRGYALPLFDKLLPKDVAFTDMESSGVWTPAGVPMHIFANMGQRERTIEPRVDDDFEMMGMQFSVRQYSVRDNIFTDGLKNGLT